MKLRKFVLSLNFDAFNQLLPTQSAESKADELVAQLRKLEEATQKLQRMNKTFRSARAYFDAMFD